MQSIIRPIPVARRFCPRVLFFRRCQLSNWTVDPYDGLVYNQHDNTKNNNNNKQAIYQVIVGLEIHAQLDIATKLFSPASTTNTNNKPNSQLDPFDIAVPGYLPVLSKSAVQKAVLAAAALNCEIHTISRFERKHYAYADLPHSYQITQQTWPLATNGMVRAATTKAKHTDRVKNKQHLSEVIQCGITRIQLECDSGKTIAHGDLSLIDFDRAGTALIEIVCEPHLRSGQQAAAVVASVRQLLLYVGACQGKMQEGQLRVDCNVNLERLADRARSPRVEIKNLNSIQQVAAATDYEACRQAADWYDAKETGQLAAAAAAETRTWDASIGQTILLRRKDDEQDYRFMPEPDLPPLLLDNDTFDGMSLDDYIANNLAELPSAAMGRLKAEYGLSDHMVAVITSDPPAMLFLDQAVRQAPDNCNTKQFAAIAANLLSNELFRLVNSQAESEAEDAATVSNAPVTPNQLGKLALMQYNGEISSAMAKKILEILFNTKSGDDPASVAKEHGFALLSDPAQLLALCEKVLTDHPDEFDVYCRGGKFVHKMRKVLIGKAMAESTGNAHPDRLQEALDEALQKAVSVNHNII
jgi:aspartyl-tRNA(Asn)/glutamyl-tRNA(Gln) amidotransferase subunit B